LVTTQLIVDRCVLNFHQYKFPLNLSTITSKFHTVSMLLIVEASYGICSAKDYLSPYKLSHVQLQWFNISIKLRDKHRLCVASILF